MARQWKTIEKTVQGHEETWERLEIPSIGWVLDTNAAPDGFCLAKPVFGNAENHEMAWRGSWWSSAAGAKREGVTWMREQVKEAWHVLKDPLDRNVFPGWVETAVETPSGDPVVEWWYGLPSINWRLIVRPLASNRYEVVACGTEDSRPITEDVPIATVDDDFKAICAAGEWMLERLRQARRVLADEEIGRAYRVMQEGNEHYRKVGCVESIVAAPDESDDMLTLRLGGEGTIVSFNRRALGEVDSPGMVIGG